jgi:uncharacterized protein (DUF849 family)
VIHEADWAAGPVAIVVAPTGAEVTRADNPAVPYTPGEIAREVIEAHAAGAAIAICTCGRPTARRARDRSCFARRST